MAKLYKRGKYWWAFGVDTEGKRWWKSTKVPVEHSRRTAEKVARKIEAAILLGSPDEEALELIDVLDLLVDHMERKQLAKATLEIAARCGKHLISFFGARCDVHKITLADVESYLDHRRSVGTGDHTIEKEVRTLTSALRQARRHNLYPRDPSALWPDALRGVYQPRDRWLTVDEYARVLEKANPGRRDHFTAYVYLGCRFSELYRITAEDLDYQARAVFIRGTKGDPKYRERWVPAAPPAWRILRRLADEHSQGPLFRHWTRQNARQAMHRWCKAAGVPPVSPNDLRRTFCSWLASAGVPELTCSRMMGHSSSTMVRRVYAQLSAEALRGAIDRLPRVTLRVTGLPHIDAHGDSVAPCEEECFQCFTISSPSASCLSRR